MTLRWNARIRGWLAFAGVIVLLGDGSAVLAQIPGLPGTPPAGQPGLATSIDPEAKHKATVAASTAPITVKERISDSAIQQFLAKFLPKYPGVRQVQIAVDDGVVTLEGRVDDDDSRDEITGVVTRVEGVRLALNQMTTDEESMSGWESAAGKFSGLGDYVGHKWVLILVAVSVVALAAVMAKAFAAHSETFLAPFVRNVLLRSVVGSVLSSLLLIGGVLLALGALDLTRVVLSILGLAGMVGLAVGFAFRDITENFIASVLLGLRRPFQIGDYITVAGQSGAVKSLNTRATVLVTLEGNHVRIPNAVIFKEIMVNATASPSFRNSFDVVIPNECSTIDAIDEIARALATQQGVLANPPPRALVEAIEPGGVRLRVYLWSPTQGVDWIQLMSDARLKVKLALEESAILPGPTHRASGARDHPLRSANGEPAHPASHTENSPAPSIEHALEQPETRVSEEGTNLLGKP